MKISRKKITWMSISCAFALLSGMPAIADDTELLLLTPNPSRIVKPNVMFILDTSGSMTTTQETSDPYNGTGAPYPGACNPDAVYYTDVSVIPGCDGSNEYYIDDDNFFCEFSTLQMLGIGSFTNTFVQYRDGGNDGTGSGPKKWQTLAPGYNSEPVECQADSGVHGDGTSSTRLWASNGTNLIEPFTDTPSQEISWGSSPRNINYTFYDGNYLNWLNSPTTVTLSRQDIMKSVTKAVLSSVSNLNVGLMRFDGDDGGPVILDITDLDTNRQAVLDAIDALPASGNTPLSETLYESALFWRGMPAHFGTAAFTTLTDPNALAQPTPEVYERPDFDVCAKNFNVLLTDGQPVEDFDTPTLAPLLPNFDTVIGPACSGTEQGDCLDDVAKYLFEEDVDSVEDGDQLVTTHTIGFTIDLDILRDTALASGGRYFLADDVASLTQTLLDIIGNINERSLSFAAPAVSVNTFNRTQTLNDLYITAFGARGRAHWPGNLKKYRILDGEIVDDNDEAAVDPDTGFFKMTADSIWSGLEDGNDVQLGGAANELPAPGSRNLYTNNLAGDLTVSSNHVSPANSGTFSDADFGLIGATGEPSLDDLILWARGQDLRDEDNDGLTTDTRNVMGDPLHSAPAAIVYGGTAADPDVVIYTATNDGYLHAIAGELGNELWAFIPKELLSNMTRLYFNPSSIYKQYGLDGNVVPIVKDVDRDGIVDPADGDFVYIIFGMRRGGGTYYALDVTDKDSPSLLWDLSLPEISESWSTPVVARVDIGSTAQNSDNAVVVIGSGYDSVHDSSGHPIAADGSGAGIHFLDLVSGNELWRAGPDSSANLVLDTNGREMDRAIPNQVRVIDLSGDGLADRMYATDLGGQIWRFDITNGDPPSSLVAGGVIAQLGGDGTTSPTAAETRRFYNAPDVSLIIDEEQQRRYISVSVGTGYRAHPFDLSASDRFYSFRDADVFNQLPQGAYTTYDIATDSDFVEVSGQTQTVITSSDRGWRFTLPGNQKILADSLTFDDQVFFVAFTPDSESEELCAAGQGTNFLYRVRAINGDPVVPNITTLDPDDSDDERRETLQQGGIAPSPTMLFPSPEAGCTGDECDPPPLACVGVECFDPDFENNPVRTLWSQDGIE